MAAHLRRPLGRHYLPADPGPEPAGPARRTAARALATPRTDRPHHRRARRSDRADGRGRARHVRRRRSPAAARRLHRVGAPPGQPVLPGLPDRRALVTGLAAAAAVLLSPPPRTAGRPVSSLRAAPTGPADPATSVARQPIPGGRPVGDQHRLRLRARPDRDRSTGLPRPGHRLESATVHRPAPDRDPGPRPRPRRTAGHPGHAERPQPDRRPHRRRPGGQDR